MTDDLRRILRYDEAVPDSGDTAAPREIGTDI